MLALRRYMREHGELLFEALELSTCGYYLRPIEQESTAAVGLDQAASDSGSLLSEPVISRRVLTTLGYPFSEEAAFEKWMSLLHPDDLGPYEETFRQACQQLEFETTLEYRMLKSDGRFRYTRETGRVVPGHEGVGSYWLGVLQDIDEQTRARQAVAQQRDELSVILNTIPTYVWFKDADSRILKVNRSAADATGLPSEEIEGKLTAEVYPHNAAAYAKSDRQVLGNVGEIRDHVEQLRSVNGTERLMSVDKYNVQIGNAERILVVGTDITNIEAAQDRLAKSEAQFRELFDSCPVGLLLVNGDGVVEVTNGEALSIFGYSSEEMVGLSVEQLVPPKSRGGHVAHRQGFSEETASRRMGGGRRFPGVKANGSLIQVEVALTRLMIDDRQMTLATVVDVTERTKAEFQLKLAAEVGDIGFWDFDVISGQLEVSPQLLRQLGETTPWTCRADFDSRLHADDLESVSTGFSEFLAQREQRLELVFRMKHVDGTYRWILSRGHRLVDDDGTTSRVVGFHVDISAERQTQSELEQKTLDLERSNQDLNQFAYVASHDLKAPLRGIQHLVDWIIEDLPVDAGKEISGHLDRLKEQSTRMHRLLDDLLAYAGLSRVEEAAEMIDLSLLIDELFKFMTPPPHAKLQIERKLPIIKTYRGPLEQVLRNLIGNAIQHGHPTGVTISVSCVARSDGFCFCVEDDGPGIEAKYYEQIFDMFRSLKSKDQGGGTGMGLAMVKRIVELQGGRCWLESELGKGARFHFLWPTI